MSRFVFFLAFLAKNGFGLTVYNFQMKNRRSMKIYSNVPKGNLNCIACIWLTCMHSFLSYDYLNHSSYLSITPRTIISIQDLDSNSEKL